MPYFWGVGQKNATRRVFWSKNRNLAVFWVGYDVVITLYKQVKTLSMGLLEALRDGLLSITETTSSTAMPFRGVYWALKKRKCRVLFRSTGPPKTYSFAIQKIRMENSAHASKSSSRANTAKKCDFGSFSI